MTTRHGHNDRTMVSSETSPRIPTDSRSSGRESRAGRRCAPPADRGGGETLSLPEVAGRVCRRTVELIRATGAPSACGTSGRRDHTVADHGTPAHLLPRLAARYRDAGRIAFAPELCAGDTLVALRDEPLTREWASGSRRPSCTRWRSCRSGAGRSARWLTLGLDAPPRFTETALSIARGVARQAAPLIDNARLFTNAQKARSSAPARGAPSLSTRGMTGPSSRDCLQRGAELFEVSSGVFFSALTTN